MKKRIFIIGVIILSLTLFFFIFKNIIERDDETMGSKGEKPNIEHLRALPYAAYTEGKADQTKSGVTIYNKQKTCDGYNLVWNKLMDMEGKAIKKMPGYFLNVIAEKGNVYGRRAVLLHKFDWTGHKIWESLKIHHDISITPRNTILTITKDIHEYQGRIVEFDTVVEVDEEGTEVSRWSTWESLEKLKRLHGKSPLDTPGDLKNERGLKSSEKKDFGGDYDYYHANSIQELPDNALGQRQRKFQKGNWLLLLRNVNLLIILDKETKEIIWSFGINELEQPHHARMLENGHITLFDNGPFRGYTRIIELNPLTKRVFWEYQADPPESFQSKWLGSCQRLPNGNTLIGDGWNGRAFEITKEGEIVWEWFNPEFNTSGKRKNFYQIIRYPTNKIREFLEDEKKLKGDLGRAK